MDLPLLRTKYLVPPVRADRVPRPHLMARLNAGLARKCTLVSAPAGSGKTTLVSMWLSQCRGQVAWLSLDEGDNDPVRFCRYLLAALRSAAPGLSQAIDDLQSPATPPALIQALTVLINEIAAQGMDSAAPLILVLDDYHTIRASAVHDGLAFLLDSLPAAMHVALLTRADPPLPLSRLRAHNQLSEIRTAELRFTPAEAAAFFNQVMGLRLSADEVQVLEERTEGWAVGLQMAALALQSTPTQPGEPDSAGLLQAWGASNRYLLDYLVEEVLAHQPEDVQAFLLRTAILDRLTGPLCDAILSETGMRRSGQEMLEWLERANLFVVPLDPQRTWYRYHHLLAESLRQRLQRSEPGLASELHRRASQWYGQHGLVEEAIDHALSGEDLERAASLIEQASEAILMRGELVTLTAWFGALPHEIVRQHPLLGLYYAGVLLLNGEPPARIQAYLPAWPAQGIADTVADGATILRALLALWQGDVAQSVQLGQQALASLPEQSLFWRGIVTGNLGIAYGFTGRDLDLAERMLEEAARLGEKAGSVIGAVVALCNLAEVHVARGQLRAARGIYDRALALAVDERGRRLPIGNMAVIGMASLLQEWNELGEAERLLTTATDRLSENLPIWAIDGYLALVRVKQSQGDAQAAQRAIEAARAVAASTGATELDDWIVAATQARLWIAQGDLDAAARWARSHGLVEGQAVVAADAGHSGLPYALYELERLALAELWMAQGEAGRALDLLAALLAEASAYRRTDSAIRIRVLTALAHQQLKQLEEALAALAQALALAQPGGYVRTFVDRGLPMAHLLRQALAQGTAVDSVPRLLAAFGPGPAPPASRQMLVEPLSDRELQVLRLLAAYLSSAEIGQELYISANTVRFHLKNIYAKLNVHSRADAVQWAQELELL